jgi:hypothetical protein
VTRSCALPNCQRPAKKATCCGQRLCDAHELDHDCPRARELLSMSKADARAFLSREDSVTVQVVDALNVCPDIELAWQARRRGGVRANDAARAVADVIAVSRDGIHVEVEMKGSHRDACPCDSCVGIAQVRGRERSAAV